MADREARERAIRQASEEVSNGSAWVRRAAESKIVPRAAKSGRVIRKNATSK